jgi:hypothetical protein
MQGFTKNTPVTSSLIASYYTDVVGDITLETTLFNTTIPAGKMQANGNFIESVYCMYSRPGNSTRKNIRAYFSGQIILDTTDDHRGNYTDNSTDSVFFLRIEIIRSTSSLAKSSCCLISKNETQFVVNKLIPGINFTGPITFSVTGQGDGGAGITGVMGRVVFYD